MSSEKEWPRELAAWRARGELHQVFGQSIFVIDTAGAASEEAAPTLSKGEQAPLVILHGFPSSSFDYHLVLGALANERRVVVHDHLGFGFSEKPPDASYSLFEQAEFALELWRQLGIHRAHLLAHDYGTSVATEILARRERGGAGIDLRSVTLSNGSLFLHLAKPRLAQKIARSKLLGPAFGRWVPEWYFSRVIRKLWGDVSLFDDAESAAMWSGIRHLEGHHRTHQISSYLGERERFLGRWRGALSRLDLPLHVLWARRDPVARVAVAEHLIEVVPDPTVTWLEEAGHFPMLEAPAEYAAAASRFWRGLAGGAGAL